MSADNLLCDGLDRDFLNVSSFKISTRVYINEMQHVPPCDTMVGDSDHLIGLDAPLSAPPPGITALS